MLKILKKRLLPLLGLLSFLRILWEAIGHYGNVQTLSDIIGGVVKNWPNILKWTARVVGAWWFPIAVFGVCLTAYGALILVDHRRSKKKHSLAEPIPGPSRLRMSCSPDIAGCVKRNLFTGEGLPTNFFRVKVEAEGEKSIKNCMAILTSIEKNGKMRWGGDSAKLTFAQGEAPDRFSKTIRSKIPEFFDVLAVTSKGDMFPGTYDAPYGRWWPYQPSLAEIFSESGDYILGVAVSGDDVPTETALLNFNWTCDWQTSALTLIPESSGVDTQPSGGLLSTDKGQPNQGQAA